MMVINDSNCHLGICFLGMFFYFIFLLSFSSSTDYLQIDYDHYLDHDHHLDLSNYENGRSKSSRGLETQQHVSSFRYNFFCSLFTSLNDTDDYFFTDAMIFDTSNHHEKTEEHFDCSNRWIQPLTNKLVTHVLSPCRCCFFLERRRKYFSFGQVNTTQDSLLLG